jgi:hypothetical protein
MRLVGLCLFACVLSASAALPRASAQAGPPALPDLAVSNLTFHGELNPGGRIQFEATVSSTGKFPKGQRQLTYAFQLCRQKQCTGVAHGTVMYTPGAATPIKTPWQSITPWLPKAGTPPDELMVFVKDKGLQEDFANNEQWIAVSVGALPKAPYAYEKFDDREIDGKNAAKLSKVSRDACLLACSADFSCKSVDYAPKTKTCYLQNFHRKEVGKAYKKSKKYDHYARPCRLNDSPNLCST